MGRKEDLWFADRCLPTKNADCSSACRVIRRERESGARSLPRRTRCWSKRDSNRWSPLRRGRLLRAHRDNLHLLLLPGRSAIVTSGTEGSNPVSTSRESREVRNDFARVLAPTWPQRQACLAGSRRIHPSEREPQEIELLFHQLTPSVRSQRAPRAAAQRFQAFERAFFVRTHQQRLARHIGGEDHGEAVGLAHSVSPAARRRPERKSSRWSGFR